MLPSHPNQSIFRRIVSLQFGLSALIAAITLAVYWPVHTFDFLSLDDPDAITLNPHLTAGLSLEGLRWAFTSTDTTWFPLTRLSELFDYQLFRLNPGGHHLTSVVIHIVASLLLFAWLRRATSAVWPSVFVAFVFALHPLHVQSVAWVAERKDVLCALFWFLTLWAWTRYVERPSPRRYALSLLLFVGGLMSKPMIVTLPVLLLLLDFWPYRRSFSPKLFYEKLPFLALAAADSVLTFLTQRAVGAVQTLAELPLTLRTENSVVSVVMYLWQTLWPRHLAIIYPYPDRPVWHAIAATLFLLAVTAIVVWKARKFRFLLTGWLWFLITLLPVIGIVQVGLQSRADRYMYVPMAGLAIMLAWAAAGLVRQRALLAVLGIMACVALTATTFRQVSYWKNSETLYREATRAVEQNFPAYHYLGLALTGTADRLPEAAANYETVLRINPNLPEEHVNLCYLLLRMDRVEPALQHAQQAVRANPRLDIGHIALGTALLRAGRLAEAFGSIETGLRLNPEVHGGRGALGSALMMAGRLDEAAVQFRQGLIARPRDADLLNFLGSVLLKLRQVPEAVEKLELALLINPSHAEVHNNLGAALLAFPHRHFDAIGHLEEAVRLRPAYAGAHLNLGYALRQVPGRLPDAIAHFETALRLAPNPDMAAKLALLKAGE